MSTHIHTQCQSVHKMYALMPTSAHKSSLCKIREQVFSLQAGGVKAEGRAAAAGRRGRAQRPRPGYSSRLIVWFGTVLGMLPHKLNNSCPPLICLTLTTIIYYMRWSSAFSPFFFLLIHKQSSRPGFLLSALRQGLL